MSLSLCYTSHLPPAANREAVIKAVLAVKLWRLRSGANVALQLYNDTALLPADLATLNLGLHFYTARKTIEVSVIHS